jgi:hypothetical protein
LSDFAEVYKSFLEINGMARSSGCEEYRHPYMQEISHLMWNEELEYDVYEGHLISLILTHTCRV